MFPFGSRWAATAWAGFHIAIPKPPMIAPIPATNLPRLMFPPASSTMRDVVAWSPSVASRCSGCSAELMVSS